jgi:putative heme-binding domain-containing protein
MSPVLLFLVAAVSAPQPAPDLKLPSGFHAYLYSDQALANDIYTMTVDESGRVLVAGRGYVRVLIDDDGDGRADRAIDLIDGLKDGPMGLFAEGDSLFVVADGGLKRYRGYNGRDKLKGPPDLIYAVKTSGEHEAHAVRRGPDGWLYLMCGNMSGVKKEHLDSLRSPVKDPIAGSLIRISPDGKRIEAVCDGFRNAYSFDFNLDGEPFTYDSDNERCVGLPWYEPCRFYHIVPGGNYGWRSPQLSQTWRKPPYFADVVPPIGTTGRGSPTGVACYKHTLFPGPYRGNFFIADWTFGKIWFVPLEKKHSSYTGKPEVFLEAIGESGFAPTALAVHPKTGELLVSIGGRGTRGAVYRITHNRGGPVTELPTAKRSLDWNAEESKQWLKDAVSDDAMKRRHALEMMLRWREKLGWGQFLGDAIKPSLSHDDALVRAAAGRAAVGTLAPLGKLDNPLARLTFEIAAVEPQSSESKNAALSVLSSTTSDEKNKLIAIRLLQLALGDLSDPKAIGTIWEGYSFRQSIPEEIRARLFAEVHKALPAKDADLDREIHRTLAALGGKLPRGWNYSGRLTERSRELDDIHVLTVLSRVQSGFNGDIATGLLNLEWKIQNQRILIDRNWPLRVEEISRQLAKSYPELCDSILRNKEFGQPEHVLFVKAMGLPQDKASQLFLSANRFQLQKWTSGMVSLLDAIPSRESRPTLLNLWSRGGLEDSILLVLAREPNPNDGPKFVVGLRSMNPEVVKASAAALNKLEPQRDKADLVAAIVALRRLADDKASVSSRDAVTTLLKDRTGQSFTHAKAWAEWLARSHPELAVKVNAADGFDPVAWKKRESNIPWAEGDPVKGRAAFTKATCASCHDGGGAIGPSLAGVAKRFSRDDLLASILQPSKDVSPRYRPTRIGTTDGKVHIGMIVYEAVSGVMLQTGPDAVVRIAGEQIESQKLLDTSLMPAGLLDKLSDREVADLLAYLRKD